MEVFVGRQPILDRQQRTVAYELLFRSGVENRFDGAEENMATSAVMSHTFLTIGSDRALGRSTGFINFPRRFLVEDRALLLPHDKVVIEILEHVAPDSEVVGSCKRLKQAGYKLALDDIIAVDQAAPLVQYADYAKIDFVAIGKKERRRVGDHFRKKGLRLLAEKVETREDFETAAGDGYELFQGYFFARPEIISAREIASSKLNCVRLLGELHRPELDFKQVEGLLRFDVALVRKLLCFVNSAAFPYRRRIDSISQALICLGESNIRKWVAMAAVPELAKDRPGELVNASLVRARFCELAAPKCGAAAQSEDCFLMGLLSLMDVMIGRPLDELLSEMAVDAAVSDALLGASGGGRKLRQLLDLAVAFERSDVERVARRAAAAGLDMGGASELYVQAIEWEDALERERSY